MTFEVLDWTKSPFLQNITYRPIPHLGKGLDWKAWASPKPGLSRYLRPAWPRPDCILMAGLTRKENVILFHMFFLFLQPTLCNIPKTESPPSFSKINLKKEQMLQFLHIIGILPSFYHFSFIRLVWAYFKHDISYCDYSVVIREYLSGEQVCYSSTHSMLISVLTGILTVYWVPDSVTSTAEVAIFNTQNPGSSPSTKLLVLCTCSGLMTHSFSKYKPTQVSPKMLDSVCKIRRY